MSEHNPLFSVQVAVYNAEKTLSDSVNSILSQPFQNYEVLLVDDCSTDGSGSLCDALAAKHPEKIRTFHNKENLGLLLTRRVAYREARGEWIISVDADDRLSKDAFSVLAEAIRKQSCDLVLYKLLCRNLDGTTEDYGLDLEDGRVYNGADKKQVYLQRYKNDHLNSMCTKAVRRSILDTDEDYSCWRLLRKGTDIFQSYPLLDKAQKILYLNRTLYTYEKRPNSMTTAWQKNWYPSKKILWQRDDEYLDRWGIGPEIRERMLHSRLKEFVVYIDSLYRQKMPKETRRAALDAIRSDSLLERWYDEVSKNLIKPRHRLYCNCLIKGRYRLLGCVSRLFLRIA